MKKWDCLQLLAPNDFKFDFITALIKLLKPFIYSKR